MRLVHTERAGDAGVKGFYRHLTLLSWPGAAGIRSEVGVLIILLAPLPTGRNAHPGN